MRRILPCGDDAVLVELDDLDEATALAASLRDDPVPGVADLVPGARTVLVQLAAGADRERVIAALRARDVGPRQAEGELVEVRVVYDGEDLAEVARLTGLSTEEVVARHAAATYRVAFTGFAPGFAYLSGLDPALAVPRRETPRARIPAGALAVAGEFTAVYPRSSPGGWRLIGRALDDMWRLDRDPPALLRPGMRVRFVTVDAGDGAEQVGTGDSTERALGGDGPATDAATQGAAAGSDSGRSGAGAAERAMGGAAARSATDTGAGSAGDGAAGPEGRAGVATAVAEGTTGTPVRHAPRSPAAEVVAAGPYALIEDLGRPGAAALGVSPSGAMDRGALRRANAFVGNEPGAAAIETALGGLVLRARGPLTLAVTGAEAPLTIRGQGDAPEAADDSLDTGDTAADRSDMAETEDAAREERVRERSAPFDRPFALADGEELTVGAAVRGVSSIVAFRGGIDVDPVLGSRSRDVLAGLGPEPLVPGAVLPMGSRIAGAALPWAEPAPALAAAGEEVWLDVVLGPRDDWFTRQAILDLTDQDWGVQPQSNRVGLRLAGERPLARGREGELPSEATVTGALQVPPDGQPILFAADRPLTGGYPVIAVVTRAHLDRAAQAPPGARIRFRAV